MCMETEGSDALKGIQTVKKIMKKRERGTCLTLELMHRLSFYQMTEVKIYIMGAV